MYVLHIANKNYSSWSLRPWVLLHALGIPFEERLLPFPPDGDWSAFRALSPTGQVPLLEDAGTVVWDSLAIVEYLAERHSGVWPEDAAARAWARCAAAEMHAGFQALRGTCPMNCGIRARFERLPPALAADVARVEALWNDGLARFGGPFLAGAAFTAADAFFAPVAFRVQSYALPLRGPAADYAQRLLALPAMRDWYRAALAESWRERGHEAAVAAAVGEVEDLRG
ncbi:glutathione S-transferase [Coralloluteibacterium thermophilus]|uniref:Glutathione S-transferase n=1 Tax=Coralloluteibacterium thermophilum TaxID=2707049 RepID=A0ABV9NJY9_9GAMM